MKDRMCNQEIEDKRIHTTLKSYLGSYNVFYCVNCGQRFMTTHHDK